MVLKVQTRIGVTPLVPDSQRKRPLRSVEEWGQESERDADQEHRGRNRHLARPTRRRPPPREHDRSGERNNRRGNAHDPGGSRHRKEVRNRRQKGCGERKTEYRHRRKAHALVTYQPGSGPATDRSEEKEQRDGVLDKQQALVHQPIPPANLIRALRSTCFTS